MASEVHAVIVADDQDNPNIFLMTDGLAETHVPIDVPSILVNKSMAIQLKEALSQSGIFI